MEKNIGSFFKTKWKTIAVFTAAAVAVGFGAVILSRNSAMSDSQETDGEENTNEKSEEYMH